MKCVRLLFNLGNFQRGERGGFQWARFDLKEPFAQLRKGANILLCIWSCKICVVLDPSPQTLLYSPSGGKPGLSIWSLKMHRGLCISPCGPRVPDHTLVTVSQSEPQALEKKGGNIPHISQLRIRALQSRYKCVTMALLRCDLPLGSPGNGTLLQLQWTHTP